MPVSQQSQSHSKRGIKYNPSATVKIPVVQEPTAKTQGEGLAMESSKLGTATASSSETRRWFRIARAVLLSSFLLFAIATYSLWHQYQSTRPTLINQDSGQVHQLYAGNWVVYVTTAEQFRLYGLAVAAAASLAATVALDTFVLGKNEDD